MRNRILMSFAASAFLLMMGSAAAYAQVSDPMVAKIPFKFTVENTTLPAGTYVISSPATSDSNMLAIRQENGDLSVLFLTESVDAPEGRSVPKTELVFDRVGTHDFLRQVWESGNAQGEELPKPKQETRLEQTAGKAQQHRLEATPRKAGK